MEYSIESVMDMHFQIDASMNAEDGTLSRDIFFNYQPSPYAELETLFSMYPFAESDRLIEFGCGKGRVLVMAMEYGCQKLTGYEIDDDRCAVSKW